METFGAIITTCRNPSRSVRALANDLTTVLPHTRRLTRGKLSVEALGSLANELKASFVVIIGRWHGGPGDIQFFEATSEGLRRTPPTMIVGGYRLQREIGNQRGVKKTAFRRVAIWSTDGAEVGQIADTLGKIFQLPQLQEAASIQGYDAIIRIGMDETHSAKLSFFTTSPERNVGPMLIIKPLKWGD